MISADRECDYCKENISHDGKCYGYSTRKSYSTPCLGFKKDPRGKVKFEPCSGLTISISDKIPELRKWTDDFTLKDKDTPIQFTEITPLKWITERMVAIKCKVAFYYYDNSDYDDEVEKKLAEVIPIIKLRKGGTSHE